MSPHQTIFMLGINGSGMRSLALLLNAQGHTVAGCDRNISDIMSDPNFSSIQIYPEEKAVDHLSDTSLLIYSDAIDPNHHCRAYANTENIPQQSLFQYLGNLSGNYTTIAVAGTHGKSSTTAFLGHIMIAAGLDPTILLGASVPGWPLQSARLGHSKYFLVEADEYFDHFLELQPSLAIITTIDYDHPDFFKDIKHVTLSFQHFINSLPANGSLITLDQLPNQENLHLNWPKYLKTVAPPKIKLKLSIPGTHMQNNAWLAINLALELGISEADAIAALKSFPGLARRFEVLGKYRDLTVISDYSHHPTEIAATIKTSQQQYPGQKILLIFEPHTATRLSKFYDDFLITLTPINDNFGTLIVPTFLARTEPDTSRNYQQLYQSLKEQTNRVSLITAFDQLPDKLSELSLTYEITIALTAGELDQQLRQLIIA